MSWSIKKAHVLVPFDFSDAAKRALEVARAYAETPDGVTVLYVVMPPAPAYPGVIWGNVDSDTLRERAAEAMAKALEEVGHTGGRQVVTVGQPAHEIIEYATDQAVDLVVIPSHGRKGLERWLLGSVAERVVRLAPCPVLVLRTKTESN